MKVLRVLIVDDELDMLRLLNEIIISIGWECTFARDGFEGHELFKRGKYDLVISDIYMPRMNGLELLSKIKQESPETPIILITGYTHFKQLIQSLRYKPDGFLQKPFDVADFLTAIGSVSLQDELTAGPTASENS